MVCPNHALDRLLVVPRFRPSAVNRASRVESLAGGKGMIVSRAARRLGSAVAVHGFVGGAPGQLVRQGCRDLGARDRNIGIEGETRTTTVVIDEHTSASTVVNERGPFVGAAHMERLYAQLADDLRPGDVVVSTGSLPDGCPPDFHARVGRIALEHGCVVFVDAADEALAATVADLERLPAAMGLKVNIVELAAVVPAAFDSLEATMDGLARRTGSTVVVTRGELGATWRSPERAVTVRSPQVEVVNATGSGDCFLAGLAVATGRGQDPQHAMVLASAMGAANAASLTPDVDPELVHRLAAAAAAPVAPDTGCRR